MLYKDSTEDFITSVKSIETRADLCLKHLALLTAPVHLARWTVLSATAHLVEDNYKRFGPDSSQFKAAMINLSRHAPILIRSLGEYGMASVSSDWVPDWDSFVGGQAFRDLRVIANYDAFLMAYPMWYRGRLSADLLSEDVVRFSTARSSRDRQVGAFQKGLRRRSGVHQAVPAERVEATESISRRYERILDEARAEGKLGFRYEHSYELARRMFRKYMKRMGSTMRRT